MALGYRFTKCPTCGSPHIREVARVEAGTMGNDEDFAIYHCPFCWDEFDQYTNPPEEKRDG